MAQDFGQQAETHAKRVFRFLESGNIVVVHSHAEGLGEARDLLSDGAEPHDPQDLVAHLMDGQRRISVPAARGDVGMLGDQPARHRSISSSGVLGDGDRLAPPLLHIGTLALIAATMSARS